MREERLQETRAIIERTILVRRITLGAFCLIALAVLGFPRFPFNPLFTVPFAWLLLTFPFGWLIRRPRDVRALHHVHAAFLAAEAVLITYLVHRLGGVAWVGVLFYLFTVMYANFFLPKFAGYVVTALAVGGYALVALLQYFGILPHVSPFAGEGPPHRDLVYVLATILVGGVGFYSILAFTVRAFAGLYERKNWELLRRERALARLSAKLLTAQEEERRRIARRIHDEVGQVLAAARWALAAGETKEAEKLLAQGIEALRDLARELRPPLLDEAGLAPALRRLLANLEATGLTVHAELEEGRYPELVETAAFRVIQEALENVRRHAQARHVWVRLEEENGWLVGEVRDDGRGFDPAQTPPGLGLSGMREWVELLGGTLALRARPGQGTHVTFRLPCAPSPPRTDTIRDGQGAGGRRPPRGAGGAA
ncbi:MAG: sensor histidine kinase [Candidatus Bipolaricaulota bacterium]|nr:sensor histidine kinase [Candidatus Bipolaricaulota bacterium]MDW8152044.1 sensor histidine kinase [Candidatus Bipolaricaulota bacterium]